MMKTALKLLQIAHTRAWIVAVCPDDKASQRLRWVLASSLPEGAVFSGRTALLAEGGRISVVSLDDRSFDLDQDFQVYFLGGCGSSGQASRWRAKHAEARL